MNFYAKEGFGAYFSRVRGRLKASNSMNLLLIGSHTTETFQPLQ